MDIGRFLPLGKNLPIWLEYIVLGRKLPSCAIYTKITANATVYLLKMRSRNVINENGSIQI